MAPKDQRTRSAYIFGAISPQRGIGAGLVLPRGNTQAMQWHLFNAHYDEYIFQPIHIFEAITGKHVLPLLRPGKQPSGEEAARILKHVIRRIRRHWPRLEITVRGDGHYGTPDVMALLEDQACNYIFGPPGNARPSKIGQPWCEDEAVRRVQRG